MQYHHNLEWNEEDRERGKGRLKLKYAVYYLLCTDCIFSVSCFDLIVAATECSGPNYKC